MGDRLRVTIGLWLVALLLLGLLVARGGPWLWPRLFPAPGGPGHEERRTAPAGALEPPLVAETVHRTLASLGTPPDAAGDSIHLPQGAGARDLELALRAEPVLASAEVYVTPVDDLLWRLRIIERGRLLMIRDVLPWLPERPAFPASDPPEIGIVVLFRGEDDAGVLDVSGWRSPLALGLPPFATHAVRSARQAAWSNKGVVALVDPATDLGEQVQASPDAGAVLLESDLPVGTDLVAWLAPLDDAGLALIDARAGDPAPLRRAAADRGVSCVRLAARLDRDGGDTLARNLAVRWGHALVAVDGSEKGLAALERFVESVRQDGYSILFPSEVALLHGRPAAGSPGSTMSATPASVAIPGAGIP